MKTLINIPFEFPASCASCPFIIKDSNFPHCMIDKVIGKDRTTDWDSLDARPQWCPIEKLDIYA